MYHQAQSWNVAKIERIVFIQSCLGRTDILLMLIGITFSYIDIRLQ